MSCVIFPLPYSAMVQGFYLKIYISKILQAGECGLLNTDHTRL